MTKIFIPGETITTQEEFSAGKKTFAENGLIKATVLGEAIFDKANRSVSINGHATETAGPGDIVFGRVAFVKDSMVVIDLVKGENGKKIGVTKGQLPVRNVAHGYISNLKSYFKTADSVKARVVEIKDGVTDLETKDKGLGVIMAFCSNCRSELKFSNDKLACFECGHVEQRKWFEQTNVGDDGPPRNNRFDRNGRGGDRRGGRSNDRRSDDRRGGDRRESSGGRNFRNDSNNRRDNFRGGQR